MIGSALTQFDFQDQFCVYLEIFDCFAMDVVWTRGELGFVCDHLCCDMWISGG